MTNQNGARQSFEESYEQRQDFDDSANDLWALYGKEANIHDQARINTLKEDMDGVLLFAGLFSGVIAAFVVPQIQSMQPNPANQSVYFQNQSVQMLDRISQQLSMASQIPTDSIPPPPYPTFHPSGSARRVNIIWLISLVCSLSAAILATLVQQWVRAYMRIFQQYSNPLKTARIRMFLFEGAVRLPIVAEAVPGLIHVSLMLFLWGLGDIILQIDTAIFVGIVIPITLCVSLYFYCVAEAVFNPQSPYRTPFSGFLLYLIRKLHRSPSYNRFHGEVANTATEERQEQSAMKRTKGRLDRDVRAIRWLVANINESDETQTFVMAMPGSFNQEWGRDVWKEALMEDQPTTTIDSQIQPQPVLSSPREGSTTYNLCRCVRYLFGTYSNDSDSMGTEERLRRTRGCVETAASLVCCTQVDLGSFGEVREVLSELGDKERTNDPLTIISNPLFTMRWTCLSLVAIWKMIDGSGLQELAKFALFAHLPTDHRTTALATAERTDDHLKKAWAPVLALYQAFDPWSQDRTESEIRGILTSHEASILQLESIAIEDVDLENVDSRISLLQKKMDAATHKLLRRLTGVSFSEMKPATPIMISDAFDFSYFETTPVPPRLIFPGQQIQSLCTLGQGLRDIIERQNTERHEDTLKSLKYLQEIPVSLRGFNYPVKRQLWRLLDLRDGGGFGFTIELFFLALRQLSSASLPSELKKVFYTGTFKVITSNWEKSKNSAGTQRVLLDLLCNLVISSRGVFSDFSYPPYIVDMLLDLVGKMVEGHGGEHPHINDVKQELILMDDALSNPMDSGLRGRALIAIGTSSNTASS